MKNFVGFRYHEALKRLNEEGCYVEIKYTRPPNKLVGIGDMRVIVQTISSDKNVELIVANEDYSLGVNCFKV